MSPEEKRLRERIKELEEALEKEISEKERIASEKERIISEKERLEKEFEEFKAKHSKTIAELRKALRIRANKKQARLPSGARPNHKGYGRRVPERIDYLKVLNPKRCLDCGESLSKKTTEIRPRHVTDIRLVSKTKTTRYDIHRKYCRNCKKIVEPEVPNVLPHARFGLNLMLLVLYLRLGLRIPGNKVCEYFLTMYQLSLSEGEIVHILKQLVMAFGEHYAFLEKMVKQARVKYTDSTGWPVNGKNYFAWVFIGAGIVLYKIRKRNNHKVALQLFGKQAEKTTLVVDRHAAFRTLAEKAGFLLQLCWSHILRDSKQLAEDFGAEGRYVHQRLKGIYACATGLNHKGTEETVEQLQGEILQLTFRHYRHLNVWKFVQNLASRDIENLFRFVCDPNIDPNNNISERELRAMVVIRKISNGSRSPRGANATATLLSVIQTLRYQKKNVLLGLQEALKNPSGY